MAAMRTFALLAAALAAAVVLAGCGGGDGDTGAAGGTASGAEDTTAAASSSEEMTTQETQTGSQGGGSNEVTAVIKTDSKGNAVGGLARIEAKVGQRIVLTVRGGTHDEIHIHGYDLVGHSGPGLPPAKFSFQADTPGVFEIELEGAGKQIGELTVSP